MDVEYTTHRFIYSEFKALS